MSDTLAQLRSRAKSLYDESFAILSKTGGAITAETTEDDRSRLQQNKGQIQELETRMTGLVQDEADSAMFAKGHAEYNTPSERHQQPRDEKQSPFLASVGDGVVRSPEYEAARKSGALNLTIPQLRVAVPGGVSLAAAAKRAGLQQKALLTGASDTSGGAFLVNDRLSGYTTLTRGELAFLDALPTITTTSDVVEWVEQTTRTNSAAPVAEATATTGTSGLKPESALAFVVNNKPAEQIATWIPATTRILNDLGLLRSTIDDELLYMLREELEVQTITGNGTSPNLQGLNTWPGIQTMAAGANPADAIFNAALAVRFTGGVPATAAVVGPTSLAALRLMRENAASGTYGGYLFGPPNQPGPMSVFGLDVLTAQAVPANTGYVLNMTATTLALVEREGGVVETGYINDQFIRNIVTLRAELRALLIVRRPKGIVKLTGMP